MLYGNCGEREINGLAIMCGAAQTALAVAVWWRRLANTRRAGWHCRKSCGCSTAQVRGKEAEGGQTPPWGRLPEVPELSWFEACRVQPEVKSRKDFRPRFNLAHDKTQTITTFTWLFVAQPAGEHNLWSPAPSSYQ